MAPPYPSPTFASGPSRCRAAREDDQRSGLRIVDDDDITVEVKTRRVFTVRLQIGREHLGGEGLLLPLQRIVQALRHTEKLLGAGNAIPSHAKAQFVEQRELLAAH